ncbi:filamentous hemagglutinin-like protein [Pandoraea communis]|uniref:Filamentous hemagglutinin-like protein n=1 Tax=Pandoraea communis TaxID=2508297 RepID=A0A5E4UKR3_9BURK|nr:filamentous haemagglutinin family protein [Pandoraea communis]VVE00506.1 filamentous hemagglutinin-like protein [Pandoraea communis]
MSMRGREGATAMQSSGCRNGIGRKRRSRRVAPVAQAITLLLTTMGAAHAQQAFSNAWFAARGAAQATASQTGRLPNGMPVTSLMDPTAQQQQANAQLQRSIANLSSAAQNIAAMQAAQANARAAAASSDTTIPDGLTEGGLKVDTNSLTKGWINAQAPTQTSANGKTHVNIQQTANKAILNWETFNVGRNTSVNFAQQSDWAVLNRVNDPQARPSQIQGQIHGDGTVLVLNRNGVIFGGTSQVDTRNLVVAAARMSDAQFQMNGIYGANGTTPTFTDALGKVEVQAGANITTRTPTSVTQGGGYVLLLGNQVSNAGTIVAPQGQVALAAGDSFVIRKGVGTDANTPSTTRGNEVSPQFVAQSTAGKVVNSGLLMSPEGDITLAGRDVQQLGTAVSTTTVNTRGTIHLLNSASDTLGKVTLGSGALTSVLISDNGATALDSQRAALMQDSAKQDSLRAGMSSGLFDNLSRLSDRRDQSRVEIVSGGNVEFQGNSLTLATGGQLAVSATGRSFVANGAQLDVSGAVGVSLSMDSNNVKINVQGNEQRDAPGNRDNTALNNANVYIDRRRLIYVPASVGGYANERWYTAGGLLEVGGYLANQTHGIGEWAAQGGTVTIGGNEVVTQKGALINLSGGSLNVQTGYLNHTWLKGVDGQLYNVNTAPSNVLYTGVYNGFEVEHRRWGKNLTESYASPLIAPTRVLQNGYTVGRDAGRLSISAPTAVLEGDVVANVYTGPVQTQARPSGLTDGYTLSQFAVPRAGSLTLGQYTGVGRTGAFATDVVIGDINDITNGMSVGDTLTDTRKNTVWLDASRLNQTRFGEIDLVTAGTIGVRSDLQLDNGGRLALSAPSVDVMANLFAPSGTVAIANQFLKAGDQYATVLLPADGAVHLTLAPGYRISTRGVWVNAALDPDTTSQVTYLNGGSVTFDSTGDLTIGSGSVIDVSSGGAILAGGKTKGGTGGNVTLIAGDGIVGKSVGTLTFDGTVVAYGVNGGGTLTLSTPDSILIGNSAGVAGGTLAAGTPAPVSVKLAQTLTIPAGTPLPMDLVEKHTTMVYDTPLQVDVTMSAVPVGATLMDWIVPTGLILKSKDFNNQDVYYFAGDTLPAGTVLSGWGGNGVFLKGTVVPSNVFPNGVPVNPYQFVFAAGSVVSVPKTYDVGAILPAGTSLAQTIAVTPVPTFNTGTSGSGSSLFNAGFANYDINGGHGVRVDNGVALAPVMPVYRFTADSMKAVTGSDPSKALALWTPPLFAENPQTDTISQRAGASIALRSLTKDEQGNPSGGTVAIAPGASITVDPGQSITLDGFGQITVDGALNARAGKINLIGDADGAFPTSRNFDENGVVRGTSLWLGPNAKLDVSGLGYTALDTNGRTYGTVFDGGTINLSGGTSFVVIRPGAELNADGASVLVDTATVTGQPANASGRMSRVSNGGAIAVSSFAGSYLDGNLHAFSGGAGASGGDLSVSMLTPFYPDQAGLIPSSVLVPSTLTVTQSRPEAPDLSGPGAPVAALPLGRTSVSADMVKGGGFSSLSLTSGDYMMFKGDVSLALDKSLKLNANAYTSGEQLVAGDDPAAKATGNTVRLAAPYVLLSGTRVAPPDGVRSGSIANPGASGRPTTATFEIDANLIDVQGPVIFSSYSSYYDSVNYVNVDTSSPGFRNTRLVSQGDIRFLPTPSMQQGTTLITSWDMDLDAAQVYPTTGAVANIVAGQQRNSDFAGTLTLGRTTAVTPDAPLSVFGMLFLSAPNVRQGGVLRAPFGKLLIGPTTAALQGASVYTKDIEFLPGSLTSVAMDGMTVPYGGTVDGVTYTYNGTALAPLIGNGIGLTYTAGGSGISLEGLTMRVDSGAVLDLSGGGTIAGAGFVSGRGGSVNVLNTPLVNANPTMKLSKASDKVYAIVPGYTSAYAPIAAENGAGDPAVGQRVTIGDGVPGLPAGTYTLLPSNYALLPGAYRVEIGGTGQHLPALATAAGNGTYLVSGYTSIANTSARSQLPSTVLVTPGTAVRKYSQYNEQSYADFMTAQIRQFGGLAPMLPRDGKGLGFTFDVPYAPDPMPSTSVLSFNGKALFQPAAGGVAGQVAVLNIGEITTGDVTPGFNGLSVNAASLNAIGAPRLSINGTVGPIDGVFVFQTSPQANDLYVRDGVTLSAGEIYLVGNNLNIGNGVTLTTIGRGPATFDTASTGMLFSPGTATVLGLSNGDIQFLGSSQSAGSINIGAGSGLYAEGTLAFATNGASNIDDSARFGARNIALAVGTLNVGDAAQVAAAGNPAGVVFNQSVLNTLLQGDPTHGAPALQRLTLSTANSINLFGSNGLDTRGTGVNLVLNASAIYGVGAVGDQAVVAADRITWNGVQGVGAPAIAAGGPGTGNGSLQFIAKEIDLGHVETLDTSNVTRTIYGFNDINFAASDRVVSAGRGALYVYQAPGTQAGDVFGQSGTGGNLTLTTPLLTGAAKSIMNYTAGGTLSVVAPAGAAPATATTTVAGAEIDLSGNNVNLGSTVLLPSGKLAVDAANDIVLDGISRIDLSGQPTVIQTATAYGFGGTASFRSAQGNLRQLAGSVVDVSAKQADAGTVSFDAAKGTLSLGGSLLGKADDGFTSGAFGATAGTFADFGGLNALLTQGGFFASRSFDQKLGDLVVGNGVKAHSIGISADGGTLTVNGSVDASGAAPGTIRLSGGNGLTLGSSAVLDAHGTILQVDSYGAPIEAKNRGHVELTAAGGTLTLAPGAAIDVSTPGAKHYGDIILNAMRTAETSGDIAIDAAGPLTIRGADSVALNGVWTYTLPSGSVITQSTMDGYDAASTAFIDTATGNGALTARTAGLAAYGNVYHLRPGVQIASLGDLATSGDIDLAKYRYGSGADRNPSSATYGAGEPMALVLRAGGNLRVDGSISDGFMGTAAGAPVFSAVTPTTFSTDTAHFAKQGSLLWRLLPSNVMEVSDSAGWVVPTLNTGGALPAPFRPMSADGTTYATGAVIPYGTKLTKLYVPVGAETSAANSLKLQTDPGSPAASATSARATMLAPGMRSASLRLVAGADLAGADQRALLPVAALGGSGNLTLSDSVYDPSQTGTFFSVLRTGTGGLDLLAGGSFSEATPYGVYTAGTQAAPILAADGHNPYNLPGIATGNLLQAWYTEHGGDLLLQAQQDVTGNIQMTNNPLRYVNSNLVGNWLNRQGGGGATTDPTAWSINFGSLAKTDAYTTGLQLIGFQGIGTLGGGNLTVIAGRDAGVTSATAGGLVSTGLDLAVASTGRVLADGSLVQTGGGDLTLKVGGMLNGAPPIAAAGFLRDYYGSLSALRGNTSVNAGSVGSIAVETGGVNWTTYDPRASDPNAIKLTSRTKGPTVLTGDGIANVTARGDLVLGGAGDAGMSILTDIAGGYYTNASGAVTKSGFTKFSLWTPSTALNLLSAGGDVAPLSGASGSDRQNALGFYPGSLSVASLNGDIRFGDGSIELMPSPVGQLRVLSAGSIYGGGLSIAMSGADYASVATPGHPFFASLDGFSLTTLTNASINAGTRINSASPLAFGEDYPSGNLHAQDATPAQIYAGIDIDDLQIGMSVIRNRTASSGFIPDHGIWYVAAKPFEVIAGRDIVGTGTVPSTFLNQSASDVSLMQAGRDIIYQSASIVGPGLLQVQAGRNVYQGYYGQLQSIGDVTHPANANGGAGVSVLAGVGANGPDYTRFARLYFDPANQLASGAPLADSGKVVHAYGDELVTWLQSRFGYQGAPSDALAYFLALPQKQQGVFVRDVYFKELLLGGREYNDATSPRYGSYLRGREAIATLFPTSDAQGKPITYDGAITLFSSVTGSTTVNGKPVPVTTDATVSTNFGGAIQMLNPGGRTLVGVEGVTPGANAGVVTQGEGDIQLYSRDSILLGLSRVMTTFGGSIQAWSAQGDINAGRGAKTTVLYTPPKRVYDDSGNVTLSPSVPSSGAGIATLAPLPEVPPGDVDLVAPLGTIDAGEAGVRVSGNVNFAALAVVNAANVQVQGKSTGLPVIAAVNVGALTNASATAAQAASAAQDAVARERVAQRQNTPSIFSVRMLSTGAGANDGTGGSDTPPASRVRGTLGYDPSSLLQLVGSGNHVDPRQLARLTDEERRALNTH